MATDRSVEVDLYAGVDELTDEFSHQNTEGPEAAYASDMYGDVMPPSSKSENEFPSVGGIEYQSYTTVHPKSHIQQEKEAKIAANLNKEPKGKTLYVGNLTWWTNEDELGSAIRECGVTDLIHIKFFENRANGQSKGFALVEVGSETSQRLMLERLTKQKLHGRDVMVTYVTKQNLLMLEHQTKTDARAAAAEQQQANGQYQMEGQPPGPIGSLATNPYNRDNFHGNKQRFIRPRGPHEMPPRPPPPYGGPMVGFPPPNAVAGPFQAAPPYDVKVPHGMPYPGGPPVPGGPMMHHAMPEHVVQQVPASVPYMPQVQPPNPVMNVPPQQPKPAPHVNPAFLPPESSQPGDIYGAMNPVVSAAPRGMDPMYNRMPVPGAIGDADLESMRRNQAVASTAIQRAMADANAGDFESGIETLVTAISLIKQSSTANTESSQVLVQSLQDCLHGLEAQLITKGSSSASGRKERESRYSPTDEYREERRSHGSRRRHRSRSRSRSRDRRYRSRSRSRDRSRRR